MGALDIVYSSVEDAIKHIKGLNEATIRAFLMLWTIVWIPSYRRLRVEFGGNIMDGTLGTLPEWTESKRFLADSYPPLDDDLE